MVFWQLNWGFEQVFGDPAKTTGTKIEASKTEVMMKRVNLKISLTFDKKSIYARGLNYFVLFKCEESGA